MVHAKAILGYPCSVLGFIKAHEALYLKIFTKVLQEKGKLKDASEVFAPAEKPWRFISQAAATLCNEEGFLETLPVMEI